MFFSHNAPFVEIGILCIILISLVMMSHLFVEINRNAKNTIVLENAHKILNVHSIGKCVIKEDVGTDAW